MNTSTKWWWKKLRNRLIYYAVLLLYRACQYRHVKYLRNIKKVTYKHRPGVRNVFTLYWLMTQGRKKDIYHVTPSVWGPGMQEQIILAQRWHWNQYIVAFTLFSNFKNWLRLKLISMFSHKSHIKNNLAQKARYQKIGSESV